MLSSSLLLNWLCLYLVAMLIFKGLGASEISVGTWDAWVPLPILALVFIALYLSFPVGCSLCLQSILNYRSILGFCNSLHPKASLTTLHCILTVHFLPTLFVTA